MTPTTRQRDALRRDAARLASGELDQAQRAMAHTRIADDPAFAREVAAMRGIVDVLGEVPGAAWNAIALPAPARGRRRMPRRAARAFVAGLACVAAGVAIGAVVNQGTSIDGVRTHGSALVLKALPGTAPTNRAIAYIPDRDHMLLHVVHLPRPRPGTYYEAWLLTDTRHLAPIVSFGVDKKGHAALVLRLPEDPHHYRYLDISVQRIGGDTSHSGHSVLRSRLM